MEHKQSSEISAEDAGSKVPREPFFRAPQVVFWVIGFLALVHAVLIAGGEDWRIWSLFAFSFIPARISGDVPFPAIYGSQVWAFVTYAFLHADFLHLLFNSLWLLVFGSVVAKRLGALRFLVLSCVAAIAGAIAMLISFWGETVIVLGASGITSGLMGAAIPLMYGRGANRDVTHIIPLRPLEIVTDRRALIFTIIWVSVTLVTGSRGLSSAAFVGENIIAWQAHLGGFFAGLVVFYLLDRGSVLPSAQA